MKQRIRTAHVLLVVALVTTTATLVGATVYVTLDEARYRITQFEIERIDVEHRPLMAAVEE